MLIAQLWYMQLPPCHFMTILVNVITIAADHNLFSWLQIHETNCCDATVWAKQEQAAKKPSIHQLLQLKGSSTERKSKSLPLPLGSHLCSHAASAPEMSQTWVVWKLQSRFTDFLKYMQYISALLLLPREIWRMDFVGEYTDGQFINSFAFLTQRVCWGQDFVTSACSLSIDEQIEGIIIF